MGKSTIAIVGRPNVGKSTLFNRIVGRRTAIIEDFPGVTRDRIYADAEWDNKRFFLIDTGGFQEVTDNKLLAKVKEQAVTAVDEADVVIFVMDGKAGLNPDDIELSNVLRASNKSVFFAVNKIDIPKKEDRILEFYPLGVERIYPISAINGYGLDDLMDDVVKLLPETEAEPEEYPKVAIVGRPNVGKSTLLNTLIGKQRAIVSEVPGTTRDAIDSICRYYSKKYLLIDTAGIRRKGKIEHGVEHYSIMRTIKAVERCDVALVLIDAVTGVVEQDKKIVGMVEEKGKGIILLFNKWDMTDKGADTLKRLSNDVKEKLWFADYAPYLSISATERKRVTKVFPLIDEVIAERQKRIPTSELNRILRACVRFQPPPVYKGRAVKLYYISQVDVSPPVFVIFANRPDAIGQSYIRFIEKMIRESTLFKGTPIRIVIRQRV